MRQHIAKHHPSLLESFEQGWNSLTPHLQARFHDPIHNRLPAYFNNLPPEATRFHTGGAPIPKLARWTSWTSFALNELNTIHGRRLNEVGLSHELNVFGPAHRCGGLCNVLVEKMDHESSIFGLPPIQLESEESPESIKFRKTNLKKTIAMAVINACLERVKIETLLRMEKRLQEEGLEGFKLVMNGGSIIDELANVDVSGQSPGE